MNRNRNRLALAVLVSAVTLAPAALRAQQPTPGPQPDITTKKGMTLGSKFSPWGGSVKLTQGDASSKKDGKCAFSFSYDEVNTGAAATNAGFVNRLRQDGVDVVSTSASQSLNVGESKQVTGDVWLVPGKLHYVEVTLDDDKAVTEWSENNNKYRIGYSLDGKCK